MISDIKVVTKKKQCENDGVKKDIKNWIDKNLPKDEYVFYKNWGGGIYSKGGRPDIEIAYKGLVNYWELKDEHGNLSTLQLAVIDAYARAGITVYVAKSLEDFLISWKKIYEEY